MLRAGILYICYMIRTIQLFKFCPKCGSKQFYASGERSMKCEKCKFEYFFNTASAVTAIILNDENHIMLTRRAFEPEKGMLDLPGGFVEPEETAQDAIKRELKEELNAQIAKLNFFDCFPNRYEYSGLAIHTLDITFIVRLESYELKAMDDVESFSFWNINDIPIDKLAFQSTKNTIQKLKELNHA